MNKPKNYHVSFGTFDPSIIEQLRNQGFKFNKKQIGDIAFLGKMRNAICLLFTNDIISETESHKAYKLILKRLDKAIFQKDE